jgi:SAM-dependent methyltransferase
LIPLKIKAGVVQLSSEKIWDALEEGADLFLCYRDQREWRKFVQEKPTLDLINKNFLKKIKENGFDEPITGLRHEPGEFEVNTQNLHETISVGGLNSRKRALLFVIKMVLDDAGLWRARNLRILSADGISRIALIMRGIFPFFLGTEFLPSEKEKSKFFPVPHMDLCDIGFENEVFDMFMSADVLEHLPNIESALKNIFETLKPGGIFVSSFPFSPERSTTVVKAMLDKNGKLEHIMEPEYHGNPVDPESGSLVFSLPGWDILSNLRDIGFRDAYFASVSSARYGILSNNGFGPFVLVAKK